MRRIVIPTDFSEAAWHATEYGLKLASSINADVLLVHAYDEPRGTAGNLVSILDQLKEDAENEMAKIKSAISALSLFANIDINFRCVNGDLTKVLNEYVSSKGDDLVVLGTLGATGIRRMFVGSNASNVIKKIDAPVLAVPPKSVYDFENGIACGIDESSTLRSEDAYWLEQLIDLTTSKKLQLVNILDEEEMEVESLTKVPENFDHLNVELVELLNNDVVEGLDEFVQSSGVDCLVLIRRNLNFFEKLYKFSVSRDVVTIIKKPLLVLRSAQ